MMPRMSAPCPAPSPRSFPSWSPARSWAWPAPRAPKTPPSGRCRAPASCSSGASAPSGVDRRVELAELDPGVGGGEAPVGRDPGVVPPPLPSGHVALQVGPVPDPLRQVTRERAELDLGHVQPRAVLGRVVDLEAV